MEIKEIKIADIICSDNSRLRGDKKVAELMQSIKSEGLLQPVGITKKNGKYFLLFGNRRLLAYKKLGYKYIPCLMFLDQTEKDGYLKNLIENIQREDVPFIELSRIIRKLISLDMTKSEIAVRLSVSLSKINNILDSDRMGDRFSSSIGIMESGRNVKKGKVPLSTASMIAMERRRQTISKDDMNEIFDLAKKDEWNNQKIKAIFASIRAGDKVKTAIKKADSIRVIRLDIPLNKSKIKFIEKQESKKIAEILTQNAISFVRDY